MRYLEEHLALVRRALEGTQTGRSLHERMGQAEEAGVALARAWTFIPDDEETLAMRKEVDGRAAALVVDATKAAEAALAEKRLGDAMTLYASILNLAPDHVKAKQRMERLHALRAETLAKAREHFQQGDFGQALGLLDTAARRFPEDAETAAQAASYREQSAWITRSLQGLPALVTERKWLGGIADLENSGVRLQGLEEYASMAAGLFRQVEPQLAEARAYLAERRPDQAMTEADRVLSQIADHPEALAIYEDACRQPRRHKSSWGRAAVCMFLLALIGGGGAAAYLYLGGTNGFPPAPKQTEKMAPPAWLVQAESVLADAESKLDKANLEPEFTAVGKLLVPIESKLTAVESELLSLKANMEGAEQRVLDAAKPPIESDWQTLLGLLKGLEQASQAVRSSDAAGTLKAASRELHQSRVLRPIQDAADVVAACRADLEKIAWNTDGQTERRLTERTETARKRFDEVNTKLDDATKTAGQLNSKLDKLSAKIKDLESKLGALMTASGRGDGELRVFLEVVEGPWNEATIHKIIKVIPRGPATSTTQAAIRSLVAVFVLNQSEKLLSEESAHLVIRWVLDAEAWTPADPELVSRAAAVLHKAIAVLVAAGELRLIAANGQLGKGTGRRVHTFGPGSNRQPRVPLGQPN